MDRSLNYGRAVIERCLRDSLPYKSVLDIGAGHGDDLVLAKRIQPNSSLNAIETYPPYIAELEQRGVRVCKIDIERQKFDFLDGTIDVVIANQILEHTKEVFWIFHEISRVLTVGGKIILGVPNLAALHNRVLLMLGRQPSPIRTSSAHVRGFTKGDVTRFLEDCFPGGYRLLFVGGSNFYPFPSAIARPLAKLIPTMAWSIFFLLEKCRAYDHEFLEFPITNELETNFFVGNS